ncbi:M23 family metallopeptidase [Piscinibacter sp. HJYY11]|uniref:M23 family metallopeptidase n=1 Tax=Piscinibacter sp. HJYY11 TaxID=2801333 RepID=UPI00191EF9D0|nr:M23 family metallopeptidase [Piscinibacter sp. HJYY11]MBL0730268.1 M23 family metallopeptidase [Piscinibacter sp. HJYY11]
MQIMITHGSMARTRVLHFNRLQLIALAFAFVIGLLALSGTIYHVIFLKAAREGWPVVSQVVRLVVRDEFAQRDRFMRENLDAMAQKVGEMQAKLIKLEAIGERVSGLAGVKPEELKQIAPSVHRGGQGGPFIPARKPSLEQLNGMMDSLDEAAEQSGDLFTMIESRLFEKRLEALMVPNSPPINGAVGSGFGFRSDPFSGRPALHTGLDFPADVGTPIMAAAGGVVRSTDFHAAYGNLLEIDHGNGLTTRYAHTSKILVKPGDLVKRGQVVAQVGTTGRSTGPHLHFEVSVEGVLQNPAKFLSGKAPVALPRTAATTAATAAPAAPQSPR